MINYNNLTIKELKKIAKEKNYTNYSVLNKKEIIQLIYNNEKYIIKKVNDRKVYKRNYNKIHREYLYTWGGDDRYNNNLLKISMDIFD